MRFPSRARGARAAVLAAAVAVALASGGLAYGSSADDDGGVSTSGVQAEKGAPPGAAPAGGTATLRPEQGVKPSKTVPNGSTRDRRPAGRSSDVTTTAVDTSDQGVKNLPVTKDRGKKNLPVTRDRGAR